MDIDNEHASFLSTIAFPLPSPNESELTIINPRDRHSTSISTHNSVEKPPSSRSSANSNSNSRRNRTKYGVVGNSAHSARDLYHRWVTDSWLLELGGLGLTLLSMGALVVTLMVYQNKAPPQWRWGLTLNSLLSILSQVVALSITAILASALSQQKWLWFRNSTRSLKDFGRFDDASKGPWGSLVLLCSKSRLLAFGAVAMFFVQAFQPFIQQVVTYPSRWEAAQHSNATVPRTISFEIVDGAYNNTARTYVSNPIKAGVYNGLYNDQASLSDVQPSCSSGRCLWQPYSTLAICAYVADVSQYIQTHTYSSSGSNITTFYTLPTGGLLAGAYQNMNLVSTDNAKYASLAFQNNTPTSILSDFYTFFTSNKTGNPTLLETSLQLCVQTLNTTVIDGQTDTIELSRSITVIENGGHKVIVPNDTNNYIMGDYSYNDLYLFLAEIFSGNYTVAADGTATYSSDTIQVLVDSLLQRKPYDQAAMAIFINGFATSVTNA
ncbi:hypothetical protein G7Y89_g15173 [Cudoniella acicularis]|uniref:Uncharacterized protein n=1 Tax=Cudoniella acicularis TaxID=354080 RepID=A0A8H4QS21_9HELO|nr:hypothetical protein G7Y89_g15173 [Cudoniella acicularis]